MLVVVLGANGLDDDAADETTVDVKRAMPAERTFIVYGMCSKGAMSMMYDVYCCVCCCVAVGVWVRCDALWSECVRKFLQKKGIRKALPSAFCRLWQKLCHVQL